MDWDAYAAQVHDGFRRDGFAKYCVYARDGGDASSDDIDSYRSVLEGASDERPLQLHLQDNPNLLVGELGSCCRWVIPQRSLGGRFVPDFLVARLDSNGVKWTLVELESPNARLFLRSSRRSEQFDRGLEQILEWRRFIDANRDFVQRPRERDGLGLTGLTGASRGLLLIGRADQRDSDRVRDRLQQFAFDNQIEVHSYDWLIREAENRIGRRRTTAVSSCDECVAANS